MENGPAHLALTVEIESHRHSHQSVQGVDESKCKLVLGRLKSFVAVFFNYVDTMDRDQVFGCLKLVGLLLEGSFCPLAAAVFDYGEVETVKKPLINMIRMLFAQEDYVVSNSPGGEILLNTISRLVSILDPQLKIDILENSVRLIDKCSKCTSGGCLMLSFSPLGNKSNESIKVDIAKENTMIVALLLAVQIPKRSYLMVASTRPFISLVNSCECLLGKPQPVVVEAAMVATETLLIGSPSLVSQTFQRSLYIAATRSCLVGNLTDKAANTAAAILQMSDPSIKIQLWRAASVFLSSHATRASKVTPRLLSAMGNVFASEPDPARLRGKLKLFVQPVWLSNRDLHPFIGHIVSRCVPIGDFESKIGDASSPSRALSSILGGFIVDDPGNNILCTNILVQSCACLKYVPSSMLLHWVHEHILNNSVLELVLDICIGIEYISVICGENYEIRKLVFDLMSSYLEEILGVVTSAKVKASKSLVEIRFSEQNPDEAVVAGDDAYFHSLQLPLEDRCIVVASCIPRDHDDLDMLAIKIIRAGWMNGGVIARVLAQLPGFLQSLNIQFGLCQQVMNESSLASQPSQANDMALSKARFLCREVLGKLQPWLETAIDVNYDKQHLISPLSRLAWRISVLHLKSDTEMEVCHCWCHVMPPGTLLAGLLPGIKNVWDTWFALLFLQKNAIMFNDDVAVASRVELLRSCIEILRMIVHTGAFSFDSSYRSIFLAIMDLLLSSKEPLRNVVAREISIFVEDSGGGREFRTTSSSSAFTPQLLRVMFAHEEDTKNLTEFMKRLNALLNTGSPNLSLHKSLLDAIGSVGCTADLAEGHFTGSNLLCWSFISLTRQYFKVLNDGKTTETEQLILLIQKQLRRMAKSHGFEKEVHSVYELVISVGRDLFPQLFSFLFSGTLSTEQPLMEFLFGLLEIDVVQTTGPKEEIVATHVFVKTESEFTTLFVVNALKYVLPQLLRDEENLPVIVNVAKLLYRHDTEKEASALMKTMIVEHYKSWVVDIMAMLVDSASGAKLWERIMKLVDMRLKMFFELSRKTILAHFVFKLVDENCVVVPTTARILYVLAKYKFQEDNEDSINLETNVEYDMQNSNLVLKLVRDEFMYMMSVLSECVQDKFRPGNDRKHALRCITRLLEMLQGNMDVFLPKVLPTIKSALHTCSLQLEGCVTMKHLVEHLSPTTLHSNLSALVACLIPCFNDNPDISARAADIVKRFLITQADELTTVIRELLPMNHPALEDIPLLRSHNPDTLARLNNLVALIGHEADSVRLLALVELTKVLEVNISSIHKILLMPPGTEDVGLLSSPQSTKQNVIDCVSSLTRALLKTSRGFATGGSARLKDTRQLRLLCSQCLGCLGAIDPCYLNESVLIEADETEWTLDLPNHQLAAHLLEHFLVDALRAAPDPNSHMQIGMAIQELLRYFKKQGILMNSISEFLASQVVEVIEPFWDTNYALTDKIWMAPQPKCTRFNGQKAFFGAEVSFETSLGDIFAYLVQDDLLSTSQGAVLKSLRILQSYSGATDVLLFVVPYSLQNVICKGNAQVNLGLQNEFVGILADTRDSETRGGLGAALSLDSASRIRKSARAVFYIVDTLTSWSKLIRIEQQRAGRLSSQKTKSSSPYEGDFHDKQPIAEFLSAITNRSLAEAAFKCGDYPRSLRYLETHIRTTYSPQEDGGGIAPGAWSVPIQFDRKDISFLYQVYAALDDEPDGVAGASALRSRHDGKSPVAPSTSSSNSVYEAVLCDGRRPTLMEEICELEHAGLWDQATECYEQAFAKLKQGNQKERANKKPRLSVDEEMISLYHDMLACLRRGGHLELLVSMADGVMHREPDLFPTAAPFYKEALWRLGLWDQLESILTRRNESGPLLFHAGPGDMGTAYSDSMANAMLALSEAASGGVTPDAVFHQNVEDAQLQVMDLLSAVTLESYGRVYPFLMHLQALYELSTGYEVVGLSAQHRHRKTIGASNFASVAHLEASRQQVNKLLLNWDTRFKITCPSMVLREELSSVRRVVFQLSDLPENELSEWVALAKTARRAGIVQACESSIRKVQECATKVFDQVAVSSQNFSGTVTAEAALWKGRVYLAEMYCQSNRNLDKALMTLEPVPLSAMQIRSMGAPENESLRKARSKAFLLATNLKFETGQGIGMEIQERYKVLDKLRTDSGEPSFYMAKFLETVFERSEHDLQACGPPTLNLMNIAHFKTEKGVKIQYSTGILIQLLRAYGRSLQFNSKEHHKYEALPRLLTLWYTHCEHVFSLVETVQVVSPSRKSRQTGASVLMSKKGNSTNSPETLLDYYKAVSVKFITQMQGLGKQVPVEVWYAAVPQLVSRLGTPVDSVWEETQSILLRICAKYPDRTLWHIHGVAKSSSTHRATRASNLLKKFVNKSAESTGDPKYRRKLVEFMDVLFTSLVKVAEDSTKANHLDLASIAGVNLQNLNKLAGKVKVAIPTLQSLSIPLGSSHVGESHELFQSLVSNAEMMQSKERPKKIKIKSSSGISRNFLCKREGRGDLRKDSRMMEFNAVVNRLFESDPRANRRRLGLSTYMVICLNENCGLLEWVNHTEALRTVITRTREEEGKKGNTRVIIKCAREILENLQKNRSLNTQGKIAAYHSQITQPLLPPFLHKWFLNHFKDPERWMDARTLFSRSCASWSMICHIIGLGDRHAENLLMNVKTGECVHVDFDCLFDKGLSLQIPEIVPFRLTPHMVDAMGLSGVDGVYRSTAEVALGILRENRDMLMNVLESFVVDPLVEWTRVKQNQGQMAVAQEGEIEEKGKRMAQNVLSEVKERLNGVVKSRLRQRKEAVPLEDMFDLLPLSTPGQVQKLIKEATDDNNLLHMYSGWSPFL